MLSIKQTRIVWLKRYTGRTGEWSSRPNREDTEAVDQWLSRLEWILEVVYGQQNRVTIHPSIYHNQFSVGGYWRTGYDLIARDCAKNELLKPIDCIGPCPLKGKCSWIATTKGQRVFDEMELSVWRHVKDWMWHSRQFVFDIGDCVSRKYEIVRAKEDDEAGEDQS